MSLSTISFVLIWLTLLAKSTHNWRVLDGPEQEKGDPVEIVDSDIEDLKLSVRGRRGTVIRSFTPTELPASVSFKFESTYDPQAKEPPTELFGTGDFRIFIGTVNAADSDCTQRDLGDLEGLQFRIFPHLEDSAIRKVTGEESHTATSIWSRYIDLNRQLDNKGNPHTGLLSDACQGRNRERHRHNCGWARVMLTKGGFALKNGQPSKIKISIEETTVTIQCNETTASYHFKDKELRISSIDTIAIGHTNISRGYQTLKISDLKVQQ